MPGKGGVISAAGTTSLCKGKVGAMETIVNLIIQLIAGVVGGNAAGAALKDYNLGNLGNTIAGAIGGVGGGAGGAILTIIAGLVKSMMASQQTR